jgi:hypothetical protein
MGVLDRGVFEVKVFAGAVFGDAVFVGICFILAPLTDNIKSKPEPAAIR